MTNTTPPNSPKWREFWIQPESYICSWVNGTEHRLLECALKPTWKNEVHVIEHAAITELQEQVEALKAEKQQLTIEVINRNQYKLNEQGLANAHEIYEKKIARLERENINLIRDNKGLKEEGITWRDKSKVHWEENKALKAELEKYRSGMSDYPPLLVMLGLWKLFELFYWVYQHVGISWQ